MCTLNSNENSVYIIYLGKLISNDKNVEFIYKTNGNQ